MNNISLKELNLERKIIFISIQSIDNEIYTSNGSFSQAMKVNHTLEVLNLNGTFFVSIEKIRKFH
jgi:hypothetical protein